MANLKPLIKYRKHLIDEKQRFLSQLYADIERIEKSKQVILDQMAEETRLAKEMGSTEAHAFLGRYLEGARKKVEALDASLKKMEVRIQAAQEDIRAAFAEMKKIEITQAQREEKEQAKARRKESEDLDEIALGRFSRSEESAG